MTEPKRKTEILSQGAKTFIESMARQHVYDYVPDIHSKYFDKGHMVEDESIDLYNSIFFTSAKKNTERRTNAYLTGEADIVLHDRITDIKSSWSLDSFPETRRIAKSDAKKEGYDWQLRAYMWLWDKPIGEIAYCMITTPEEILSPWESREGHNVDNIDPMLRITTAQYERDKDIENNIALKCLAAQGYFNEVLEEIIRDHS